MTAALPPSGEQIEISHGDQRAVLVTVGGGVRSYTAGGVDVLDGYADDVMADGARGQTLAPWPNRVRDGKWSWQGSDLQLSLTEPAAHHAIHGLVRWMPWSVTATAASTASLACTSYPQPGYPWPFRIEHDYALDDDGLTVTARITNLGNSPAPVAYGTHPYLTVGTDTVDDATLELPVETWLRTDDRQIPTGKQPVSGTAYDFRSARRIGDTQIDYAFTDLARGDDGRFRLRLTDAAAQRAVTLWLGAGLDYVEVFTGDALPDPSRRRRGLGVEPMSAPPNALATGESLAVLDPQQTWSAQWGVQPR